MGQMAKWRDVQVAPGGLLNMVRCEVGGSGRFGFGMALHMSTER